MKKIKLSKEAAYLIAVIMLPFAVAMIASANFGVSMIVAPAYIVSLKWDFLSFGRAEYIVQGIWFVFLCLALKKFKFKYLLSFGTSLIYGLILDFWRKVIPHFNPSLYEPGSFSMPLRITYFVLGIILTGISVSLFFKTYFYPQIYDFFVKSVSERYKLPRSKFKFGYDMFSLVVACVLTLVFFRGFQGVGIGTVIMAITNGFVIGLFSKFYSKHIEFTTHFKTLEKHLEV